MTVNNIVEMYTHDFIESKYKKVENTFADIVWRMLTLMFNSQCICIYAALGGDELSIFRFSHIVLLKFHLRNTIAILVSVHLL